MTPYIAKVKCKQFLSTLLSLASEHPGVTIKVKMLVQGLIDSILKPEEFTSKIQRVLSNTSPQTGLIRFLKVDLNIIFLKDRVLNHRILIILIIEKFTLFETLTGN